ncbi:uncharacterized protein LOC118900148 [Balaenoptera musculus]|uniref:Uncharacterized protein LOC118900148 n=1 Tax=Balaenoptera musculus TaxID=9771 RepID=A0A8B8Y8Y5_BALMU|nr:uncharacterized protein LOC118900148 [Balaenoptera musculus]
MVERVTSVRGMGRRGYTHLDGRDQTQPCHQLAGSPEAGHWTPLSLFTICNVRDPRTPSQVVVKADRVGLCGGQRTVRPAAGAVPCGGGKRDSEDCGTPASRVGPGHVGPEVHRSGGHMELRGWGRKSRASRRS